MKAIAWFHSGTFWFIYLRYSKQSYELEEKETLLIYTLLQSRNAVYVLDDKLSANNAAIFLLFCSDYIIYCIATFQ